MSWPCIAVLQGSAHFPTNHITTDRSLKVTLTFKSKNPGTQNSCDWSFISFHHILITFTLDSGCVAAMFSWSPRQTSNIRHPHRHSGMSIFTVSAATPPSPCFFPLVWCFITSISYECSFLASFPDRPSYHIGHMVSSISYEDRESATKYLSAVYSKEGLCPETKMAILCLADARNIWWSFLSII